MSGGGLHLHFPCPILCHSIHLIGAGSVLTIFSCRSHFQWSCPRVNPKCYEAWDPEELFATGVKPKGTWPDVICKECMGTHGKKPIKSRVNKPQKRKWIAVLDDKGD